MSPIANKVCLIVGAGASKGAVLTTIKTPPLDAEFLQVAKELFKKKGGAKGLRKTGRAEWNDLSEDLKRIGLKADALYALRLENLATFLEARAKIGFESKSGRPRKYSDLLDNLNRIVCYVLSLSGGLESCPIHKAMILNLDPTSIISFNYDLILDQTLAEMGKLKWAFEHYSPSPTVRVCKSKKFSSYTWLKAKHRRPSQDGIPLFKLHGSMHWQKKSGDDIHLISGIKNFPPSKQTKFEYIKPPTRPFIVAPVAAKTSISFDLEKTWRAAGRKLKDASCWVIWGYSFPETDTITSVLLKTCVKDAKGSQKRVIIINPDYTISKRVKNLLDKVHVEQYSTASDFLLRHKRLDYVELLPKKRKKKKKKKTPKTS